MAEWYAHIGQQQYGPVNEATLQSWVGQGRLGPYDLVWSPGMAAWSQAATAFPNWFGQSPPPLTSVMPPPGMPGVPGMPSAPLAGMKPHRGTMILVFGILGLLDFGCLPMVVFGILAWVMGNGDLREMKSGQMDPAGMGTTSAGRICGIIGVILAIIIVVLNIVFLMAIGAKGGPFWMD